MSETSVKGNLSTQMEGCVHGSPWVYKIGFANHRMIPCKWAMSWEFQNVCMKGQISAILLRRSALVKILYKIRQAMMATQGPL